MNEEKESGMSVLQLSQHFTQQQSTSKLPKVLHQIPKTVSTSPPLPPQATEARKTSASVIRRHSSTSGRNEMSQRSVVRSSVDSNYSPTSKTCSEDVFQQQQDVPKPLENISEDFDKSQAREVVDKSAIPLQERVNQQQLRLNGTSSNEDDPPKSLNHQTEVQKPLKEPKNEVQSTIGLESLQEQVRRRALRKGFTLNLMVIGRSGLGKTTFINTLFQTRLMEKPQSSCDQKTLKTTEIRTTKRLIEEKGVKLHLSVTDTPGFGDFIDNSNCWEPALQYIEEQYSKYLKAEKATDRPRSIEDSRIHCCLYFIPPTGHGLRPLDIEVLSRLHAVTNIIPVLAKADTLTIEERKDFKKLIQDDLSKNGIEVYPVKRYEDVEDRQANELIRRTIPFAVAGSEQFHEVNGRKVLGRKHLWGIVEVENPNHCEFHHLRNLLIRTHMQDLVELTSAVHYEAFRRRKLEQASFNSFDISTLSALDESHI